MRPLDDAEPRGLAREGWDSDADWDYGGPEFGCWSLPVPRRRREHGSHAKSDESIGLPRIGVVGEIQVDARHCHENRNVAL
jgi:hypothetical protein